MTDSATFMSVAFLYDRSQSNKARERRGFPEAWRKEPYYSGIKSLAALAAQHDGIVSVQSGRTLIVVAPDNEFAFADAGETDEIVREYAGNRLVGVRLVKAGGAA